LYIKTFTTKEGMEEQGNEILHRIARLQSHILYEGWPIEKKV